MRFEYIGVLLVSVIFPAILSAHPSLRLYRYPQSLIKAIGIPSFFYWAWDLWAVARGHWSFHPAHVLGLRFWGLPLEEYLFFLVIGFISIFTYEVVKSKMRGPS